ncbi:MAG TPA: hypothetical protein VH475_09630 [Tepidisphaeraceae bacterium]
MTPIDRRAALVLLVAVVALPGTAWAHVLDEYLQATLVDIAPDDIRLEINLTPGVDVAEPILALMNPNRDGVISTDEAARYAGLLKRDLTVRLDDRDVELRLAGSHYPEPGELRGGWGIVQVEFSIHPGSLAAGEHRLTVENRHLPGVSVYLVNAARPRSGWIRITKQNRNENQSWGEIAFDYRPAARSSRSVGLMALVAGVIVAVCAGVRRRKASPRSI